MAVVALAILVFTVTAAVLSGLQGGAKAFTGDPALVIYSRGAPTIFSSQVDSGLVAALESVEILASPEIFAFCSYGGESFVVRGVNHSKFGFVGPNYLEVEYADNLSKYDRNSAMIGSGLMNRLGIEVPFTLPLVGSYSTRMDFVSVVGWFKTGTTMDDELLVNLDRARFLSGTPSSMVSIIRVKSDNPESVRQYLSPEDARFTIYNLHCSKSSLTVGENFTVEVSVRNWGRTSGSTQVSLSFRNASGSFPLDNVTVSLNATSATTISRHFALNETGDYTIVASVGGGFSVTLETEIEVLSWTMDYVGPSRVMLDEEFNVTLVRYDGAPVANATVTFMNQTYVSNAEGRITLVSNTLGTHNFSAAAEGFPGLFIFIEVVDPASFLNEFVPVVNWFWLTSNSVKESDPVVGVVKLANEGTLGGTYELAVYVDIQPRQLFLYDVVLGPLENKQFTFTIEDLSVGTHYVHIEMFSDQVIVEPWYASNPDYVELVVRYGGATQLSDPGSVPIYQAAKISQGNVELALFSIGAIAAVLAGLSIVAVFSKEIHESRKRLGILKTIGAGRLDIVRLISPQAMGKGLAGASVGLLVGLFVADQLSRTGVFMLFGHELRIDWNEELLLLILVSAVVISVASALASAIVAVRETAIGSIRSVQTEQPRPPEIEEVLAE